MQFLTRIKKNFPRQEYSFLYNKEKKNQNQSQHTQWLPIYPTELDLFECHRYVYVLAHIIQQEGKDSIKPM